MDFTINSYRYLLESLQKNGYKFLPYKDYILSNQVDPKNYNIPSIILRHDVDDLKQHSLQFAQTQNELGIKGTYYFRIIPQSYDVKVISEVANLGHEIGYHYEDVDLVLQREKIKVKSKKDEETLIDSAYQSFSKNLENMRKVADVKTICMHGSPLSKYDNKIIWNKYDYKSLGIMGEPYLDLNFNEVFYLTDTGRRWDGYRVSIRDKVSSQQNKWEEQGLVFRTTLDIINAANEGRLPGKIMMTFHPQRWHSNPLLFTKELVLQNAKNLVKKFMISSRVK